MNKKLWQERLKELQKLRDVAVKNIETAKDQQEETEVMIEAVKQQIKTFK